MAQPRQSVVLLGATGSIGQQTLDVLRLEKERFELVALSGGEQLSELADVAKEFGVRSICVKSNVHRTQLKELVPAEVAIVVGDEGLAELSVMADIVVNAVLGFAGLPVTLAALGAGKRLALANKESLIAAAPLVAKVRGTSGAELLPIDSEHCAIHQCLAGSKALLGYPDVKRLLLTASGGPFRGWSKDQLKGATKEDALNHPTWSMGAKITIDSSTLMNKGLEVLEASALFGIEASRVEVVVHPQSVVHSMVEYLDGSVLAQLSRPDMRLPIAYCLGLPERLEHHFGAIDFTQALDLRFEPPDFELFPALALAFEAARLGGAAPAWLSAANEVAVDAFLNDEILWIDIVAIVAGAMDHYVSDSLESLASLYENDDAARRWARASLEK
jgi:1-deoxy-D-xylulose-5-phosphate reductoisomerase